MRDGGRAVSTPPTIAELLANPYLASDGGQYLAEIWDETRAVIEAAERLPFTVPQYAREDAEIELVRSLAAWRKRASEVLK